jgi:hypothetical protein
MAIAPDNEVAEIKTPLFGRRSTRRTLVAALAGICLLFILSPFVADRMVTWLPPLTIVLIAGLLVLNVLLRFATHSLAVAPDRFVDERQEAVRNMAYRLSHKVLAVAFGIPLWLVVSYVTSRHAATPANGASNIGLAVTYLELLYFTPTAIIAWLEPDAVADEDGADGFHLPVQTAAMLGLIVVLLASPLVASASLASPARGSSMTHLTPSRGPHVSCRYIEDSEQVGTTIAARLKMAGQVCWNGKRVWRSWGLSTRYCRPQFYTNTWTTMHCTARYLPDHALDMHYRATIRSPFLPALGRQITLHLRVDPDGHVRTLTHRVAGAPVTVAIVSRHVWHGQGNTGPLHFSMPVGDIPLVTSNPWHLSYHYACSGLRHRTGLPPHLMPFTVFSLNLRGSGGVDMSENADRDHHTFAIGDGGDFTLLVDAPAACRWTITAK